MGSFNLQWRKSTRKDLRRSSREAVSRIIAEVEKLAEAIAAWVGETERL
jgi:hypothetical protein